MARKRATKKGIRSASRKISKTTKKPRATRERGIFNTWKNAVTKPKETFSFESKRAHTLSEGAVHILIGGIVTAIIISSGAFFIASMISPLFGAFFGGVFSIITFLLFVIGSLVGWLISSGIFWIFARLLGGKGSYTNQSST